MELSVKDQVKKLVELQKVDSEIYGCKKQLVEKPEIIEQLKGDFEDSKSKLKDLEEELKSIVVKRKDLELDLQTKEDDIAKHNSQLSQLKTNKEYSAKISEIESVKADKAISEEKILLSYDEADEKNVQVDKEKCNVSERESVYNEKKKEIESEIKIIENKMKTLEAQRQQFLADIDPEYLSRYERILQNKGGLAIAPIHGMACGGCFMNITQQMISALKMQTELVSCGKCTRILYLEDES